jgi:transcriptional regulator with XRE-family HTH domain
MDAAQLRETRRSLGLSQSELAERLGLSRDYIGQMERGVAPIKPRTAMAISTLCSESIPDPYPVDAPLRTRDPMEQLVERALQRAGVEYETDQGGGTATGLDFYLPQHGVAIEVKRFHSDRIAEQMSRAPNVIALQGEPAIRLFCDAVERGLLARQGPAPSER